MKEITEQHPSQMSQFEGECLPDLLIKAATFIRGIGEFWVQSVIAETDRNARTHSVRVFYVPTTVQIVEKGESSQ